jgi:hypothetical protein
MNLSASAMLASISLIRLSMSAPELDFRPGERADRLRVEVALDEQHAVLERWRTGSIVSVAESIRLIISP